MVPGDVHEHPDEVIRSLRTLDARLPHLAAAPHGEDLFRPVGDSIKRHLVHAAPVGLIERV